MDDAMRSAPFADLTTVGRTTGQPRTVEMWFAARGSVVYLLAGDREHAHWVRNIAAHPSVAIRIGGREFVGRGRAVTDPAEEQIARDALVAKYQPGYPEDLTAWRNDALPIAIDLDLERSVSHPRSGKEERMSQLLAQVHSMLASSPARWSALAAIGPLELLERRPAAGEWSAIQCLQHVVDTEHAVFRARIVAILQGRDFAGFDPDVEGLVDRIGQPARDLATDFGLMRAESLVTLGTVGDADLDRRARHSELGVVTLRELLNQWAAHDTMHIVQAERALMQAFIPGSGPWRRYFADHDVDATRDASA